MKESKVNINGKQYHYLSYSIYLNRGETHSSTKSLGPVETSTPQSVKVKLATVKDEIANEEARERTQYWIEKVLDRSAYTQEIVQSLELTRSKLIIAKELLGEIGKAALETAFITDFIYNSNKIEGSKIPRSEVEQVVKEGGKKEHEVISTIETIEQIKKFNFSTLALQKAHSILLRSEPEKHGLRKVKIIVGNDETLTKPEHIRKELSTLFSWYKKNKYCMYPCELAATFHYRFERIHPFIDGNGRMGRILMNKILRDARYHPIIIWNKNRDAHFNAFQNAVLQGSTRPILRFMNEQYKKTYDYYLEKIGPAEQFDILYKKFLSPSE